MDYSGKAVVAVVKALVVDVRIGSQLRTVRREWWLDEAQSLC